MLSNLFHRRTPESDNAGRPTTTMKRADLPARREPEVPPEIIQIQKLLASSSANDRTIGKLRQWALGRDRNFVMRFREGRWYVTLSEDGTTPRGTPIVNAWAEGTDEDLSKAASDAFAKFNQRTQLTVGVDLAQPGGDRTVTVTTTVVPGVGMVIDEITDHDPAALVSVGPGGDYRKDLKPADCHL